MILYWSAFTGSFAFIATTECECDCFSSSIETHKKVNKPQEVESDPGLANMENNMENVSRGGLYK